MLVGVPGVKGQCGGCAGNLGFGPDPGKVDTSEDSYAAWVSVADVSASKSSGEESSRSWAKA